MIQIRRELSDGETSGDTTLNYKVPMPKLPKFEETVDDIDSYIERFERFATTHQWKPEQRAVFLSPLLTGKALQAYVALTPTDAQDYEIVKRAVLERYMLTEEGYRSKFRDSVPDKGESVGQFTARMTRFMDRWIDLSGIEKTFKGLRDLILREQFQRRCHAELRLFLKERKPSSIAIMKDLTETYLAAHGVPMWKTQQSRFSRDEKQSLTVAQQVKKAMPAKQSQVYKDKECFLCH